MLLMRLAHMGFAGLLFGATSLAAQTALPIKVDSVELRLSQGKKLFEGKGLCFSCHGAQGEGVLGPSTRLAAGKNWIHVKGQQADIVAFIRSGVDAEKSLSGSSMPARGGARLSDAEVDLLAAYVIELHKHTPK